MNKFFIGKIVYGLVTIASSLIFLSVDDNCIKIGAGISCLLGLLAVIAVRQEEVEQKNETEKKMFKDLITPKKILKHRFYKDSEGWFIDLPEFINLGLGTKANLAMVCGADTLLDQLSEGKDEVIVIFSDEPFSDAEKLTKTRMGADISALKEYGHPLQFGAYYHSKKRNHELWLCPVTVYVFGGYYPDNIYIKKV